jgi:broad specificity phosphatase PhoE
MQTNSQAHMAGSATATRVLLVRHGATTASADDRFAGSINVALSDDGRRQAARLGERLAREPIAAAYCSDLVRARDTAALIAGPHNLVSRARPALREIDHGHWEGMVHREVEQQYAKEYAAWSADPLLVAPPGGNTGLAVLGQALPAMREIVAGHAGQTVLVVSHKATNRFLLAFYLGIDLRRARDRIEQDLCCLNILSFRSPTEAQLLLMNDTSHCGD